MSNQIIYNEVKIKEQDIAIKLNLLKNSERHK